MKRIAVIGAAFGDEGKGRVVDYLCSIYKNSLVVRYSGGQQASHHVMTKDNTHTFSNFGSGTIQGSSTYWSEFCTFDPVSYMNELSVLYDKNIKGHKFYINRKCPVTTPFDKFYNREENSIYLINGTCGMGVGSTKQREEDYYSFLVEDLQYPKIVDIKLKQIEKYYDYNNKIYDKNKIIEFIDSIQLFLKTKFIMVDSLYEIQDKERIDTVIFEGSQGLLLDQNFGFFPNVTRSDIGTKNILNILEGADLDEIFLVSRSYLTRHGIGPIGNNHIQKINNVFEHNNTNKYQGEFNTYYLDLDLLKYSIYKDEYIRKNNYNNLVITCMDIVNEEYKLLLNGDLVIMKNADEFINKISTELKINDIYISSSPYTKSIYKWKHG